jgi:hypothetical protein
MSYPFGENMVKLVWKALFVFALLLVMGSPAWAGKINVMLDPVSGGGNYPYYLLPGNGASLISWQSCTGPPPTGPLPTAGPGSEFLGDAACLAFTNYSGGNILSLNLTIDIPAGSPLIGDTIQCSNEDSFLTYNCGTITIGPGPLTLTFAGGSPVEPGDTIFIGETTSDGNTLPNPMVSMPSYDPSTLVLLAAGIGMLAMCGVRRYA